MYMASEHNHEIEEAILENIEASIYVCVCHSYLDLIRQNEDTSISTWKIQIIVREVSKTLYVYW